MKTKPSHSQSLLTQFCEDFKMDIEQDKDINGAEAVDYLVKFYEDALEALDRDKVKP